MQNVIVNVNGQIIPPHEAMSSQISVFDRGFLYGDSLYEVIRTYQAQLFSLDEHLLRLQKSAEFCRMKLDQPLSLYRSEILRTLNEFNEKFAPQEAYCRIIVSRGEGKIGFGLSCLTTPSLFTILVQPLDEPTPQQLQRGLHLKIVNRLRNHPQALDPAMKSGNYLNNLLAYLEAADEGYDDALLCNADGHLTEGTTFNLFYIRRGIIATPPLEVGILNGITRNYVITLSKTLGLPLREVLFPKERLHEADEVFLTSTIKEVFPITQINGRDIQNGKPGPITLKLRKSFRDLALQKLSNKDSLS